MYPRTQTTPRALLYQVLPDKHSSKSGGGVGAHVGEREVPVLVGVTGVLDDVVLVDVQGTETQVPQREEGVVRGVRFVIVDMKSSIILKTTSSLPPRTSTRHLLHLNSLPLYIQEPVPFYAYLTPDPFTLFPHLTALFLHHHH